jgi:glycosyltransferase involved in cell wall biosynthesis
VKRETVHVLAWRLLDYRGEQPTYGGAQRWLTELARLLNEHGHDVVVHQRASVEFVREPWPGLVVRGHCARASALATPWFSWQAHRSIPSGAPVVYMAEDLAHPICRPRSVVIQHGIWWDGEYGWLRTRLAERLARHAVSRAAAVVCVDTNFINWYRARWPLAGVDEKLHFVANFVDPEQWGPEPEAPAAQRPGRITICFPRRSEPRRGIWLMADVAPRLAARFEQVDFRFVVGSGYFTEQLRARLTASGVPRERWSLEVLPFEQMRPAYEQSQIVVIPTLCGEGTSLSAIEAMHFGCAIVSTWVGGLANLIQDGENGLLTAPVAGQVEAALERLVVDAGLRARLGASAMRASRNYGVGVWRERVAAVLQGALGLALVRETAGA